ncbi:cell wall-binding repeat-containing protein [Serinicoccus sediminis]|uniref:cell wall-binding repeat-containing protein n=1 Tax=Serinicoccus sediminis TaxID=2306021 RepID=UPI0013E9F5CC|nr:cell wall-binding repeat-containing protein [Serinicoccus sediminis]
MIRYLVAFFSAILLSALSLGAAPTVAVEEATSSLSVERITGDSSVTVAAAATQSFPSGQPVVFVVNAEAHPDAMVAATRAGSINAPVLLVGRTSLPSATQQALTRLSPKRIVVVGGDGVVADSVLRAMQSYTTSGTVERVSGINRYVTAAELSKKSPRGVARVYLAGGLGYADAMSGAALAGFQQVPMTLTRSDRLHPSTREALQHLRPTEIVVLGGPKVVSSTVAQEAAQYATSGRVTRLSGDDRYATAAKIAGQFPTSTSTAYVGPGTAYTEALVAAAAAGRANSPMLLTRPTSVPSATGTALDRLSLRSIVAVGTRANVSDSVVQELRSGGTAPSPAPGPSPAPDGRPLLGGYLGGPGEKPDERFRQSFGAWPDVASTYYQASGRGGGTINRAYEQARINRGTIPLITVTSANGPYTMDQIGSGAADQWIDYWARELAALKGEVWFTFDHEFEVKLNQGKFGSAIKPADYARAFNRFQQRVTSQAPNVKFVYWYGYHDTAKIDAIGSRLDRPDIIALDPYVFKHHSSSTTFEQMAAPKLAWLRGREWYADQPIIFGEFAKDSSHGQASMEQFLTSLRPRMESLGITAAVYFSRNKSTYHGIQADITNAWPVARDAYASSVTQ